jgi:hypothetical protein
MGEVRLDAGKAPRFGPAARPTAGYDALLDTQHAISRCPSRSDARSWPGNRWNPGNVGLNTLATITDKKAGFRSLSDTWADYDDTTRPPDADRLRRARRVRTRSNPRAHQRRTRARQGARRQAWPQTETNRPPEARSDPPSRPRACARHRPELQRLAQHDLEIGTFKEVSLANNATILS